MKIWALSDIHASRDEAELDVPTDTDIVVVAGDVADGLEASLDYLQRTFAGRVPVIWVAGNHEFFGEELPEARATARDAAGSASGLFFLDDAELRWGGVRFLGSTLWTDYRLGVQDDPDAQRAAMRVAASLPDHREIWMQPAEQGCLAKHFSPRDALAINKASVAWLTRKLGERFAGPTVVVSHHAPHPTSVAPAFKGDPRTPAYVTDLSDLIHERGPDLWLHGHTHASFDYIVRGRDRITRVVCNPKGFRDYENPGFQPGLLIDVTP
ncbi:metallophosphoesterase [Hansschlegelia beijingensis]|uniref:metallophosphoesterase n=1 Tax=Hansschlegelia beijingensis TaxID=1133344 RepID=UPI00387F0899